MNSIKTKSNNYTIVYDKAVAGVVLVPEGNSFEIYVAWEWESIAQKKFFGIIKCKLNSLGDEELKDVIYYSADFGDDVTHDPEARKLFPLLFSK